MPSTSETERPLDVLALIDHFVLGGAETLLARFALAAPAAGIRLRIACLAELDGNPAAAPLVRAGAAPVNLRTEGRWSPRGLRAVRAHIAAVQPEVVHTHLGAADLLGSVAARSLGIPSVSTIHTSVWGGRLRDRAAGRVTAACASRIVAVSEAARRDFLVSHPHVRPDRVVTIHNGIGVAPAAGEGAAVRAELGLGAEDQVAVMVSALRAEKGHAVALEAVRRLAAGFPRLRLVIVGRGLLHDEIARAAAAMDGRVILAGLRHDVMRVLDAADVCLHPSHHEAFPTTIIEAMAAGVPVIATAVGGIPEIITSPDIGALIPAPPDATELAGALERLLLDPARRRQIAAAARTACEARFASGPWLRRTRDLYEQVIAEAGRRQRVRGHAEPPARARSASAVER